MDTKDAVDDDHYKNLQACLLPCGRGRPRNPPVYNTVTQKLLVQLYHLIKEGRKPRTAINDWLTTLCPKLSTISVAETHLYTLAESAERRLQDALDKNNPAEVENFLSSPVDLLRISDALTELGITRINFASPPQEALGSMQVKKVKNSCVIELEQYRFQHGLQKKCVIDWLHALLGEDRARLHRLVGSCYQSYKKLSKSKNKSPALFQNFLDSQFPPETVVLPKEKSITTETPKKECSNCTKIAANLELAQRKISDYKTLYMEQDSFSRAIEQSLVQSQDNEKALHLKNEKLEVELKHLKASLQESKKKIKSLENVSGKCSRKLKALQAQVRMNRNSFRKQLEQKNSLIVKSNEHHKVLKQKNYNLLKNNRVLKEEIRDLKELLERKDSLASNLSPVKSAQNNTYSDSVRKTVIALQSDAGVAASKVENVIKIVSKDLFHHEFSNKLPCKQTAINMSNEGGVVSKIQVAESLVNCDNATLHLDGTSRDHRKVVGHQISLDNGDVFWLGFTPVSTEDASTLLEVTIDLLTKISECYSGINEQETKVILNKCLHKITSTMSDRASVMKKFDEKFKEFLDSETGKEVKFHFLFCNAHFLLGLSNATLKALEDCEKEIINSSGQALGRDKEKMFNKFKGEFETSSNRVIRTLCDILGPRGDQKNGCRVDWVAFCENSKIPSFKSNRFNCFFEAAAAIIHHLDKIKQFFSSGVLLDSVNLKIKSVGHDIDDDRLMCCLCAVALMFIHLTSPYWKLINSSVKYFELYTYFQELHSLLLRWAFDPSEMLSPSCAIFGPENEIDSPFVASVFNYVEKANHELLKSVLKNIASSCVQVTERQLKEFLITESETGNFSTELDENAKEMLRHCPVTNLIGERAFGDLDYDINKRPNCSFFNRSASHAVKRNKTVQYLSSKSRGQVSKMFTFARKHNRKLKQQSMNYESEIKNRVRQKMMDNQQKKIDKTLADINKNAELLERLKNWGGPCKSVTDVDELYNQLKKENRRQAEIMEAFKDEIRFQKLLRSAKHLTLKGTILDLRQRLKDHFEEICAKE